jgi:hypothetical protein
MMPPILLTLIWAAEPPVAELDAEARGPRAGDRIPQDGSLCRSRWCEQSRHF